MTLYIFKWNDNQSEFEQITIENVIRITQHSLSTCRDGLCLTVVTLDENINEIQLGPGDFYGMYK